MNKNFMIMAQSSFQGRIIRPSIGTYIALLNVFPILCPTYLFIAFTSGDLGSWIIFLSLSLYVVVVPMIVWHSWIRLTNVGIEFHRFLRPTVFVRFSEILSTDAIYMGNSIPNCVKLTIRSKKPYSLCIHAKWYRRTDVILIMSCLHGDNEKCVHHPTMSLP